MRTGELLSIQYLRAVAALMVLAYHACRWTWPQMAIGAAGVDVFFVISGFILWTIAHVRPIGPGRFLAHRAARVVPLYWVLTLGVATAALAAPAYFHDAKPTVGHVLLSLGFVPHLNERGEPFPLISAGWSLNYEAIFYLIFAAALLAPQRRRFTALAAGLIALPVLGVVFHQLYYLGFNLMFLQFLAGAGLAKLRLAGNLPGRRMGWALVGLGAAGFVVLSYLDLFESLLRPIQWGVPAFALVAGLVMVEDDGGLPRIGWLKRLGDASYSIYLTHVVFTGVLTHFINSGTLAYVAVAVAGSLALGLACHYLLEKPLIALFRHKRRAALPSTAI